MRLLRRIGAFLRPGHSGPPGPASSAPSDLPKASFIPASSNPYRLDLWDCSAFTRTALAVTSDPAVAERFGRLRQATGRELCGVDMTGAARASSHLQYPLAEALADGPLFKAECMEDKWDIYHYSPHLYFARSWTGDLAYRATVRSEPGLLVVDNIDIIADEAPTYAWAVVDYLIKSHLFGVDLPHPLPVGLRPEAVALFSMSVFGRRCAQGTFGDTTQLTLPEFSRFAMELSFFAIEFSSCVEAAAFVAALSRAARSPFAEDGIVLGSFLVRGRVGPRADDVTLYLSDAARQVAEGAFGPLANSRIVSPELVPQDTHHLLPDPGFEAIGVEEARRRLIFIYRTQTPRNRPWWKLW